jgi:hypothetical protein
VSACREECRYGRHNDRQIVHFEHQLLLWVQVVASTVFDIQPSIIVLSVVRRSRQNAFVLSAVSASGKRSCSTTA